MSKTIKTFALASLFLAAVLGSPAPAHSRGFVALGVGFPIGYAPAPSYYVPGYYTTQVQQVVVAPAHYEPRTETVLVAPAHVETRVFPAVERTTYDKYGWPQTVILQPARTEQVMVPDRFETRTTQVLVPAVVENRPVQVYVPGYWAGAPAPAPVGGVFLGVGGRFRL